MFVCGLLKVLKYKRFIQELLMRYSIFTIYTQGFMCLNVFVRGFVKIFVVVYIVLFK